MANLTVRVITTRSRRRARKRHRAPWPTFLVTCPRPRRLPTPYVSSTLGAASATSSAVPMRHILPRKGHEFDEASASACRANGFQVATGPLLDREDRFAVIVMLDVAEHVQNPAELFMSARTLLTDDGVLYIHTPRRCGWDSLFLALARWTWTQPVAEISLRTRVYVFHLRLWTDSALKHAWLAPDSKSQDSTDNLGLAGQRTLHRSGTCAKDSIYHLSLSISPTASSRPSSSSGRSFSEQGRSLSIAASSASDRFGNGNTDI